MDAGLESLLDAKLVYFCSIRTCDICCSFNLLDKLWRKHSQFLIVITDTVTGSKHCFTDSCKIFVDR